MKKFLLFVFSVAIIFFLSGCALLEQDEEIQNWQPSPSPKEEKVVFSTEVEDTFELFLLDYEAGEKVQLTEDEHDNWGADWGPEGERIVFSSRRDGDTNLFLVNIEDRDEIRLTENSSQDVNPRWNGPAEVLFNSDRTGAWEVFSISLPGLELEQLTFSGDSGGEG